MTRDGIRPKTRTLHPTNLKADEFARLFEAHGATDHTYLARHYSRFTSTLSEFCSTWTPERGMRVLDVGAHWLHQSVVWRMAGFEVTALDLPVTFEVENIRSLARQMDITLVACADLGAADALDVVADSSINVILFAEIIEHLTFNPVRFWKQIHRILAPGGRIVVTTPNYYAWNGRVWRPWRFLRGSGGGISVDDILNMHTYSHHWREFAMAELIRYFSLLSPDFRIAKTKRVRHHAQVDRQLGRRILGGVLEILPNVRPNLHLEIELDSKKRGIVVEPRW